MPEKSVVEHVLSIAMHQFLGHVSCRTRGGADGTTASLQHICPEASLPVSPCFPGIELNGLVTSSISCNVPSSKNQETSCSLLPLGMAAWNILNLMIYWIGN